ncbi:hypothetical protein EV122DRAFT_256803, partial [Schizophyllum commune]
ADIEDEGDPPLYDTFMADANEADRADDCAAHSAQDTKAGKSENASNPKDKKAREKGQTSAASGTRSGAREKAGHDVDLVDARRWRDAMFEPGAETSDHQKLYWARVSNPDVQSFRERLIALTADLALCREQPSISMSNVDALHAMDNELIQPLAGLRDALIQVLYGGKLQDPTLQTTFNTLFTLGPHGLVDTLLNALEHCYFLMPRMLGLAGTELALAEDIYRKLSKYTAGVRAGIQLLRSVHPRHVWDPPNGIRELATILASHCDSLEPPPKLDWEDNWGLKRMEEHIKRGTLMTVGQVANYLSDGVNAMNDSDPRGFDFYRTVTKGMWGVEGIYKKLVCCFMDTYDSALPGYNDVLAKIGQYCFSLARKIRNHLRAPERASPQERPSRTTQSMNAKTGCWRSEAESAEKSHGLWSEDTADDMSSTEGLESDWFDGFATVKDTPALSPLTERRRARQYMRGQRSSRPSPVLVSSESEEERPSPPKKARFTPPQERFQAPPGSSTDQGPRAKHASPQRPRPRPPLPTRPPAYKGPTRCFAGEKELSEASSLAASGNWQALVIAILWRFAHPLESRRPAWEEFRVLPKRRQYQQLSLIYHEDKNVSFGQHWRQVSARIMVALNAAYNRDL